MKEYQIKKNNEYRLPQVLYMRILYLIRDYDRMCEHAYEILHSASFPERPPSRNNRVSDPTGEKAIQLAAIMRECDAVKDALDEIPEDYRTGILKNICERAPYPTDAGEATYKRWRCRFVYKIAENLLYI